MTPDAGGVAIVFDQLPYLGLIMPLVHANVLRVLRGGLRALDHYRGQGWRCLAIEELTGMTTEELTTHRWITAL